MKPRNVYLAELIEQLERLGAFGFSDCDLRADLEVIDAYTQAQAIDDGVLIDVSDQARALGLSHSFAVTASAWAECVLLPSGESGTEREAERVKALIVRATQELDQSGGNDVWFSVTTGQPEGTEAVELRAVLWSGDDAKPVCTVMLGCED